MGKISFYQHTIVYVALLFRDFSSLFNPFFLQTETAFAGSYPYWLKEIPASFLEAGVRLGSALFGITPFCSPVALNEFQWVSTLIRVSMHAHDG